MKTIKHFLLLLFLLFSFNTESIFAEEDSLCETKSAYSLYACRVKNICDIYNSKKSLYKSQNFEDANTYKETGVDVFTDAQKIYNINISNHYKCAILNIQNKSLTRLNDVLIKLDKTASLQNALLSQIDGQISKNELTSNSIGCASIKDETFYNKQNVLSMGTYELCKYNLYLEYLSEYYTNVGNALGIVDEKKAYPIGSVTKAMDESQNKLNNEKERIFQVFPTVFSAYTDYENNFPAHIMLQLIKADYMIIRDKLQAVLNPINQVGYKIMNVMQK